MGRRLLPASLRLQLRGAQGGWHLGGTEHGRQRCDLFVHAGWSDDHLRGVLGALVGRQAGRRHFRIDWGGPAAGATRHWRCLAMSWRASNSAAAYITALTVDFFTVIFGYVVALDVIMQQPLCSGRSAACTTDAR